jgi:manganese efflux pump family protein
MNLLNIIFIAIGLSMDAFAVSLTKGISLKESIHKNALLFGVFFGGFQFLMPLIGWFLGSNLISGLFSKVDHWIAFVILAFIGGKMIIEAIKPSDDDEAVDTKLSLKTILFLAIATSIDALAVGVSFSLLHTAILIPCIIIGITTFIFSFFGTYIGRYLGVFLSKYAEISGGIILILIGLKIVVEHLL